MQVRKRSITFLYKKQAPKNKRMQKKLEDKLASPAKWKKKKRKKKTDSEDYGITDANYVNALDFYQYIYK